MAQGWEAQPHRTTEGNAPLTAAPDSAPSLPARTEAPPTARHRVRGSLTRQEWIRVGGTAGFVLALHAIGWGTLVGFVGPRHLGLGSESSGVGIGVTAYTLGMRTPSTPTTSRRSTTPPAS